MEKLASDEEASGKGMCDPKNRNPARISGYGELIFLKGCCHIGRPILPRPGIEQAGIIFNNPKQWQPEPGSQRSACRRAKQFDGRGGARLRWSAACALARSLLKKPAAGTVLSAEEFLAWRETIEAHGIGALGLTRFRLYRDAPALVARIREVVRRCTGEGPLVVRTGKLVVQLDSRIVSVGGRAISLTGKEYAVLELLSRRKGTLVTKEMLLDHLYRGRHEREQKIIDVFVYHLRKKLALATVGEHYIKTIWGRGYVLMEAAQPRIGGAETR
jgi:DNA-binding winged helix-turn-helix (wHTH) protein